MGRIFSIVIFLTSTLFISSSLEAGGISSVAKAAKKAAKAAEIAKKALKENISLKESAKKLADSLLLVFRCT